MVGSTRSSGLAAQRPASGRGSARQRPPACHGGRSVRAGPKAALLAALWCCCLSLAGGAAARKGARDKRPSVLDSTFVRGTDGWTLQGPRMEQIAHNVQGPDEGDMAIEAADQSSNMWYFTSPPRYGGDRTAAYNGELSFGLYHTQRPPPSNSHPLKTRAGLEGAHVILEAQCGHALHISGVLDRSRSVPTQYSIALVEDAGWIDSRTGNAPRRLDMLGVLANLHAIKIRGAFYLEPERVRLQDVRMSGAARGDVSGLELFPCCSGVHSGEMDVCSKRDTDRTPQGVRFDCKGSFKEITAIKSIYPRFARRSGGVLVTVVGENFGLTGSNTILRVNGKPARNCRYPLTAFFSGHAPVLPSLLADHCTNGKWDFREDGVDCGGNDCPLCKPPVLPGHCSNGILDEDLGETALGITLDSMGVTHDCGGPCQLPDTCCNDQWEETEVGINCGGTDCWPCETAPLSTGTAVERSVLAQGTMQQSGCFCFVEIGNLTIQCPPDNATATQRASRAVVPLINEEFVTLEDETGHLIGHDYDDKIGRPVNSTDCLNVAYLSLVDPETNPDNYVGRYLVLTGGPGVGQHSKILSFEPANKRVTLDVWIKDGEQRNVSVNTQKSVEYKVGYVKVINGGSGYSDGAWRIPGDLFHNSGTKSGAIDPVDAWGTFKADKATGRITSVEIVDKGRFESPYFRKILKKVEFVSEDDIVCTRSCQGSGAEIFVDFFTNMIMAPTMESSYIIVDEEQLKPTVPSAGHIYPVASIPHHNTLVCEVDGGDGKDLRIDVQSVDNTGAPTSSCYTEFSRGFEFGAHDYVWSLQVGIRQTTAVKEVIVSTIDFDKRTNDIYIAGRILGSCNEGYNGCFGVVGSHLPDRGRSQRGEYNPLYLDPHGTTSTFVMKLNQYARPLWTTMIDSQSQFGRIQPWSLVVDSSRSPAHIYMGGTYLVPASSVVRFWHVDPMTKRPTRIDREEVNQKRGGSCNRVECMEGVCTSTLPANDEFTCADRRGGFMDHESCRLKRCAYIEGFETRDETQDDAWIAEISQQGRWLWVKTRLSISRRGFLLETGDMRLATTPSTENAQLSGPSAVYLTLTYTLPPHSWPDLSVSLGNVAHEYWGIDVDEEDLDVLNVPLPTTNSRTRFGIIAKFSKGGAIWARRIGPLGADGSVVSLKTDGTDLYVAGNYMKVGTKPQLTFDTCSFGHPRHHLSEGAPASQDAWEHSNDRTGVLPPFTNSLCFPFANMHAHYTTASWERTRAQQWDDVSGNEMHAAVSRGKVSLGWREPSYGAKATQVYLSGQEEDGMKFPENSIPENFTICSVSRMPVRSEGTILDATDISYWAHGHYGGHPGQAWYGTVTGQTKSGIQMNGESMFGGHTMKIDDWIVMCGQNRQSGSTFLANGVDTSTGNSGGFGGVQLSINHGRVALLRGFSQWEIIEVAIWSHWLSAYDIRSVMMYYEDLLRNGAKVSPQKALFTDGIKNLFLASYGVHGQLRWHREAIGGDLTTTCMTVSGANLTRGGLDRATHVNGPSDRDEASTHWVYVGGRVCGHTNPADFGVTKYPMNCSADKNVGEYLTSQEKEPDGSQEIRKSHRKSPCSGQIVAKGDTCDVYLAKYSADTGEIAWLKRLGQRDSFESPVDIVTDDYNNEVIMVGNYYNNFDTEVFRDTFDLVAAGRPSAVGCAVDKIDNQIKARTGTFLTDDQIGYPNCSLVGTSQIGTQYTAFILSVDARNNAHGQTSRPGSQCNTTEELGCNADGLLWARSLGSGMKEASTRTSVRALGVTKAPFRNQILSWARFGGFITATGTRGVKTQGVDDDGFFNCCLKLNMPQVFDELQDVFETFIYAMES